MSSKREIVLDTETTGLRAKGGDKIIEIGCIELVNKVYTGNHFHIYINPNGREVNPEAFRVHGISNEFLKDKPVFKEILPSFLEFIGESSLVIHNAAFDMEFINYELSVLAMPNIPNSRVVDTLKMARKKFPGSPASLDALCKRFKIGLETREKHGALIDAILLSKVYRRLTDSVDEDNQSLIQFEQLSTAANEKLHGGAGVKLDKKETRENRNLFNLSDDEINKHREQISKLSNSHWE